MRSFAQKMSAGMVAYARYSELLKKEKQLEFLGMQ